MSFAFSLAIVRPPGRTFAEGLTTAAAGPPDVARARTQHAAYCDALVRAGCAVVALPADDAHPDSTFVEDTALLLPGRAALLTRPGAASRVGEVEGIRPAVAAHFSDLTTIAAPGTLDAGDVCEAGTTLFVGRSHRTNTEGIRQLGTWAARFGMTVTAVDIRGMPDILHLKSGVSALGDGRLVATAALADLPAFRGFDVVRVSDDEAYAANCVRVNDRVLVAEGFPGLHARLRGLGYTLDVLAMGEFAKMDGGLSCLSLRC